MGRATPCQESFPREDTYHIHRSTAVYSGSIPCTTTGNMGVDRASTGSLRRRSDQNTKRLTQGTLKTDAPSLAPLSIGGDLQPTIDRFSHYSIQKPATISYLASPACQQGLQPHEATMTVFPSSMHTPRHTSLSHAWLW